MMEKCQIPLSEFVILTFMLMDCQSIVYTKILKFILMDCQSIVYTKYMRKTRTNSCNIFLIFIN